MHCRCVFWGVSEWLFSMSESEFKFLVWMSNKYLKLICLHNIYVYLCLRQRQNPLNQLAREFNELAPSKLNKEELKYGMSTNPSWKNNKQFDLSVLTRSYYLGFLPVLYCFKWHFCACKRSAKWKSSKGFAKGNYSVPQKTLHCLKHLVWLGMTRPTPPLIGYILSI